MKNLPCAALMCHAPIVVPAVAGPRDAEVRATTRAMAQAAERLLSYAPEVLVVISPHTPRLERAFGVVASGALCGDLAGFGAKEAAVRLPVAEGEAAALLARAAHHDVEVEPIALDALDHGAMVPLYFLWEAGWRGETLLLSLPYASDPSSCARLGQALREAIAATGRCCCVLASGDLSHRLTEGAPAGFHTDAHRFDEAFRARVAAGDLEGAVRLDEELREIAAEDVSDSVAVALGALGASRESHEVLSYEAPYGVGYLVAVLHAADENADEKGALLDVAREAILRAVRGERYEPARVLADDPAGVFVTLYGPGRKLRGCVGRMDTRGLPVVDVVASCAVSAATRDPRFPPLHESELASCTIELHLLGDGERVQKVHELDPARYGVMVRAGRKAGVLLPGLSGIDSPSEQLAAVLKKAAIPEGAPFELTRFSTRTLREPEKTL